MTPLQIAATVFLVFTDPSSSDTVVFHKNELGLTFNVPVVTHSVEVTDDNGCKVSRGSTSEGERITVQLEACSRIGFPPGHMHVEWTVNGVKGEHHMHVRKHH